MYHFLRCRTKNLLGGSDLLHKGTRLAHARRLPRPAEIDGIPGFSASQDSVGLPQDRRLRGVPKGAQALLFKQKDAR